MERAYRQATRVLGGLLFLLGLTLVAVTIARGGGALALGIVVGVLLAALGAGRLALSRDRPRDREPA